jgi:mono/diheme cytochrome c family protein
MRSVAESQTPTDQDPRLGAPKRATRADAAHEVPMPRMFALVCLAIVVAEGASAETLAHCDHRHFESSLGACSTITPAAETIDIGDPDRGLAYAQKICAECHNVLPSDAASPNPLAAPFKKIANTPGMSITALTVWSRTSHLMMPNLIIAPNDMDDLIAYILSLKDRK